VSIRYLSNCQKPSILKSCHSNSQNWQYWFHWALMAQVCNPSYSGGRDQEDWGSKPAQANSSWDPILKKTITKRRVAQGVGPEFKHWNPRTVKKKYWFHWRWSRAVWSSCWVLGETHSYQWWSLTHLTCLLTTAISWALWGKDPKPGKPGNSVQQSRLMVSQCH
jgi:hypothetical protein